MSRAGSVATLLSLRLNSLLNIDSRQVVSDEQPERGLACSGGHALYRVESIGPLGHDGHTIRAGDVEVTQDKSGLVEYIAFGVQMVGDGEGQGEI
ncbi:hypothetical protein D3C84_846350 [compost metagenome]